MSSPKRRKKKFIGNDRALKFLQSDIRRRWMQYGENRQAAYKEAEFVGETRKQKLYECQECDEVIKREQCQIDHIKPVGKRFYIAEDILDYWNRMFYNNCEVLCYTCHSKKTKLERDRRKK